MPQTFLHDIPVDTFVKYYLNNEIDADTISSNARYQPVYIEYTTNVIYKYKYRSNENKYYSIQTLSPMPFTIGNIGNLIFNTKGNLLLFAPRLSERGEAVLKTIKGEKSALPADDTLSLDKIISGDNRDNLFDLALTLRYETLETPVKVYYIPIRDAVSDFFNNLSLYEYYGKIGDKSYYSIYLETESGKKQFYIMNNVDDNIDGHQKIEDAIQSIKIITDTEYQDPDYNNITYYSVINTRTKREVGKIYKLETYKVLDYDDNDRAHFVDTYKKEGMLNYDVYFKEDEMPISPIMKYHLYMRQYKSVVNSVDTDPASDITKYTKTNTLYYKDFTDHGEIGFAYNTQETTIRPIPIATSINIEDFISIDDLIYSFKPINTGIKDIFNEIRPIKLETIINNSDTLSAQTMMMTAAVTNTYTIPKTTAATTSITANGAKTTIVNSIGRRGAKAAKVVSTSAKTKNTVIDLVNPASLSVTMVNKVVSATHDSTDSIKTFISKVSGDSTVSKIKDFALNIKESHIDFVGHIHNTPTVVHIPVGPISKPIEDVVMNTLTTGCLTNSIFNTNDIYDINILSTATISINKNEEVNDEIKLITKQDNALQYIILSTITNNINAKSVENYAALGNVEVDADSIYKIQNDSIDDSTFYPANSLFKPKIQKDENDQSVVTWILYNPPTYLLPDSGQKIIEDLPLNTMNVIKDILQKTAFYLYRNNIFVLTVSGERSVKVRSIYKYLIDKIEEYNNTGDHGVVSTETLDTANNKKVISSIDFSIKNSSDLLAKLHKQKNVLNEFGKTDALNKIKTIFNAVNVYEKSSIHTSDRVSENVLLDKYKTAFSNVAVNTLVSKDSNIFSSSVATDKFDMYVYVDSLYRNLIRTLNISPKRNDGGICYDYTADKTYYGFINYDNDMVYFNYTNSELSETRANTEKKLDSIGVTKKKTVLSKDEQDALMNSITTQNYIKRLLNYKKYNLNAEEFNHRYDVEVYRRNYRNITDSENILETYTNNITTTTYTEQEFDMSDVVNKFITLYTEYLYSNNNSNNNNKEDVDSPTSFNRKTLPLYIDKIMRYSNIFDLKNNGTYRLKHVFSNTDDDKDVFIESLKQKIKRGE